MSCPSAEARPAPLEDDAGTTGALYHLCTSAMYIQGLGCCQCCTTWSIDAIKHMHNLQKTLQSHYHSFSIQHSRAEA
jgi:hypothetical protein